MPKVTSLTYLLQIGNKPCVDENYVCEGFFDDQKNYHPNNSFIDSSFMTPWEWVVVPEIVAYAKQLGVEVPEDPPFDISRTF